MATSDTSFEALTTEATVTAGNVSGQNDGASMAVITTREKAEQYALRPLVRLVLWCAAGVPRRTMGSGPAPATEGALKRANLIPSDMDLIELNEAFAAQTLAVIKEWRIDPFRDERLNPRGSGISLGHPVGATDGRIFATMAGELHRREGARFALETMCNGGGQGLDAMFKKVTA